MEAAQPGPLTDKVKPIQGWFVLETSQQHTRILRFHTQPRLLRLEQTHAGSVERNAWPLPQSRERCVQEPSKQLGSPGLESKGSGQASQNHHLAGRKGWCARCPPSARASLGQGPGCQHSPLEQDTAKEPALRPVPI